MVPVWFFYGFSWFQFVFYGFSWFQVGFSWLSMVSGGFYGFSWFQVDFSWSLDFKISPEFQLQNLDQTLCSKSEQKFSFIIIKLTLTTR